MSHSAKEAVQVSFQYAEEEYLAAIRFYFWRSKTILARLVVTFVLFFAVFATLPLFIGLSLAVWFYPLLFIFTGIALFHGYVIDRPRAYFKGNPKFRDEYHITFTDAGIEFHTENMSSMTAWNFYS